MADSKRIEWRVDVGKETTSGAYDPPDGADKGVVFVCAHGAGGNMNDRGLVNTAAAIRRHGVGVVRFNFLYKEKKSGRPDPMPRLKECFTAVVARAREEIRPRTLIIGGRSMGGRAASMLAAEGFECDGLLLLAYPLHPPGKPDQLRDEHLPAITVPVICFNGTRDPFCTPSLMEAVLKRVKTSWEMHWVEGADHSFHVLKSSGKTDEQVLDGIGDAVDKWVGRLKSTADKTLVMKRTFDAPRDLVWKAWADAKQAKQWWGPNGFTAPVVELATVPGGAWHAQMRGPDGKVLGQHGVLREIVPPEHLQYTFIWDENPENELLVNVDFAAHGGKTEMNFRQTGFSSVEERDGHKDGWSQSFDRLAAYLRQVGSHSSVR